MSRFRTTCEYVKDGDTFRTSGGKWVRLSNVCAPELDEYGGTKAKRILADLILDEAIVYEPVGTSYGRIVAEVWVDGRSVNSYMRAKGYTCS